MTETAIIIGRCSTTEKKQDVQMQLQELQEKYNNRFDIVEVKAYYMSGTMNQKINQDILNLVKELNIQNIMVSELAG
ncbi:hypothetical protein [Salinimicrobium sp. TH3]|uniref:hypothetical protein n=1 Tax=Salinimicrobium sp. TH3 TaxID=2997342 RepID=UPI002272D69C|nr:hypothetical protein [Salinimicrobium sp. TH3]MCY2685937.1 hypothetical protein [Salinimicrobium sp. TH3]